MLDTVLEELEERGIKKGWAKGREEKSKEVAKNLIKINMPVEQIAQVTGLSLEEIQNLIKNPN